MNLQDFWYADGLRFSCARCSRCCRYETGFVYLSKNDVLSLAKKCNMKYTDFVETYCRWVEAQEGECLSLKEKAGYDCIFWDSGCTVYSARPLQCRIFPFWPSIVSSRSSWDMASDDCPGINNGILHSREEIEKTLYLRTADPLIKRYENF